MTKTDSGNRAQRPFHPLLLGSGKLASHLHHYFNLKKIEPVAEAIVKKFPEAKLVHASGSIAIPRVHTLHPLNTFGPTLYDQSIYEKTSFTVIEEEWRDHPEALLGFFEYFSNSRLQIRSEDRALYHAQCVMIANFPQILWNGVFKEIKTKLGSDPDLFKPLLSQAVSNFLNLGGSALTGPLVRQDQVTLQKHMRALENTPFHALYQAFIQFYQDSSNAVSKGNP